MNQNERKSDKKLVGEKTQYKQNSLEELISGKKYNHHVFCSASRKSPIGSGGCVCINIKI